MKLSNEQILKAIEAIYVLDRCKLTIEAVFALRENLRQLKFVAQSVNETHQKAFTEMFGSNCQVTEQHPRWNDYLPMRAKLMSVESEVTVRSIHLNDIVGDTAPGLVSALEILESAGIVK